MSNEKIKIISDLVKIDRYRSHLGNRDKFFSQENYTDHSIDDLKKIHDIYTRYLIDYNKLGEPYPSVIESLEYSNKAIEVCISKRKDPVKAR